LTAAAGRATLRHIPEGANPETPMKTLFAAAAALLLLAGCQSAANPGGGSPARSKSFKYSTDDGSTMSSAVEVRTHSPTEGGVLMKDWIRANHPGFTIDEQEIIYDPNKRTKNVYNMITIVDPNNNAKRVYFNVTQFYTHREDSLPGVPRGGANPW
jgi:hypothetical protein